jgi:hypothetical protein
MVGALEPLKFHLKVRTRRAAIGADVLKITPESNGFKGLLVIVTMATKLVSLHPIKDETSLTLAREFFIFYSRYGVYDIISVDPGTNISQSVVEELQRMMGVTMKISLVDRHESNGAEGTNKQILRHLRCLVQEPRVKDKWSEPEYLACCQYILNSHVNGEASDSYSPFELTFGTEDAPYFQTVGEKIRSLAPETQQEFLKKLNENLKTVWDASVIYQDTIIRKRASADDVKQNCFQPEDLILHLENQRPTKLDAEYSGPYKVIKQERNTVEARHLASGMIKFLHVSRAKPFFGTQSEAYEMATRDRDQFVIEEIIAYVGDPAKRTTLQFQVKYADGDMLWIPYSQDLFQSVPYENFIRERPHLFPLLFSTTKAKEEIKSFSKQVITEYTTGDELLVNLRSFGELWYQSLELPDVHTAVYVVPYRVEQISKNKRILTINSEIYKGKVDVDSYYLYCHVVVPTTPHVRITPELIKQFPELR